MTIQQLEELTNDILLLSHEQLNGILSALSDAQQRNIGNRVATVRENELQREADRKRVEANNHEQEKLAIQYKT
jgi:hypothetical protein